MPSAAPESTPIRRIRSTAAPTTPPALANGNRAANLANFTGLKKAGPQRSGLSLAKFKIGRVWRRPFERLHGAVARVRFPPRFVLYEQHMSIEIEDEVNWLRHRVVRMRTILRYAKDPRAEAGLRELIGDAEARLIALEAKRPAVSA